MNPPRRSHLLAFVVLLLVSCGDEPGPPTFAVVQQSEPLAVAAIDGGYTVEYCPDLAAFMQNCVAGRTLFDPSWQGLGESEVATLLSGNGSTSVTTFEDGAEVQATILHFDHPDADSVQESIGAVQRDRGVPGTSMELVASPDCLNQPQGNIIDFSQIGQVNAPAAVEDIRLAPADRVRSVVVTNTAVVAGTLSTGVVCDRSIVFLRVLQPGSTRITVVDVDNRSFDVEVTIR